MPGNRIGYTQFSADLWATLCMVEAVYFIFRRQVSALPREGWPDLAHSLTAKSSR